MGFGKPLAKRQNLFPFGKGCVTQRRGGVADRTELDAPTALDHTEMSLQHNQAHVRKHTAGWAVTQWPHARPGCTPPTVINAQAGRLAPLTRIPSPSSYSRTAPLRSGVQQPLRPVSRSPSVWASGHFFHRSQNTTPIRSLLRNPEYMRTVSHIGYSPANIGSHYFGNRLSAVQQPFQGSRYYYSAGCMHQSALSVSGRWLSLPVAGSFCGSLTIFAGTDSLALCSFGSLVLVLCCFQRSRSRLISPSWF